jgi:hypothetical protein
MSKQMAVAALAIHSARVTASGQVLLSKFSGALALASPVLKAIVFAAGGTYESENRNK